jgi:glycosyltransferase involved in cell wall biosynthesis
VATFALFQHAATGPSLRGWVEGLEARGHRAVVVAALERRPHEDWDGLEVVVLPDAAWTRRTPRWLRAGRAKHVLTAPSPLRVRRLLRAHRVDVVVVKIYSVRNVVVAAVAGLLGLRRLAWAEQTPPLGPEWRLLRAVGLLPRRWFSVVADRPGGAVRPAAEQAGGVPVLGYAPPRGPDPVPLARGSGGPLRVLTVAAWKNADAKRPWRTLEAAASAGLLDGRAEFTFVGVGRPEDPGHVRVAELVRSLGVEHLVTLRHDVPMAAIPAVMDAHDVLVLPSVREQFGMVVPEAMARGRAVVVTAAVGAAGLVLPDRTGFVVGPDDVTALGAALRRLADEPGLAARMGAEGREVAGRWASPDHAGAELERLALG